VGSLIVHRLMLANEPLVLPTQAFLPAGQGRVLDMGAGSGRSTLMVALGRPASRVTALDIYRGSEYGIGDNTPDRLIANARVAGVADRVDVKVGDMRQMPFDAGAFDAGVSAYAIDHPRGDGAARARRAARVIRPRGNSCRWW
jgi:SAM-dependent methyltransferase